MVQHQTAVVSLWNHRGAASSLGRTNFYGARRLFFHYLDMTEKENHDASELPAMLQAEQLINCMEFHRLVYDSDERNLIMNHAYKLEKAILYCE